MKAIHNIKPIYNSDSKILILGSFPSVKSRETEFFYAHPQNRFWKVLSLLLNESLPIDIPSKKEFLLRNKIAVWDVIESCEIKNSSDSTIKEVKVNDINLILNAADIQCVYTNGNKAHELYNKYLKEKTGKEAKLLPSTSPANAKFSLKQLCECWEIIKVNIFSNNA